MSSKLWRGKKLQIKSEADYSLRYKSYVFTKGYIQIPGIDYTEKFLPVAKPNSVRTIISVALFLGWITEFVNIEAAFLEGRLKVKTCISPAEGLVELRFITDKSNVYWFCFVIY